MKRSRSSSHSSFKSSSFKSSSIKTISKPSTTIAKPKVSLTKKTDSVAKPVSSTVKSVQKVPIATKTTHSVYNKSSGYYDSYHHYHSYDNSFLTNLLIYDMIAGNHQTVMVNGSVQPVPYQSKGIFGILWDVTSFLLTGAILLAVGVVLWKKFRK